MLFLISYPGVNAWARENVLRKLDHPRQEEREITYWPVSLCSRTVRFFPDAMHTVCIRPDCGRVSGQTMKSPITSLSQSSLLLISTGRIVGPGAFETSFGSITPSNRFVPIGHRRMLGV